MKKENKITSVSIPKDLYEKLKAEAESLERPINWLIVKYIDAGLNDK